MGKNTMNQHEIPSSLPYCGIFALPLMAIIGSYVGGIYSYGVIIFIFIILAIIENVMTSKDNEQALTKDQIDILEKQLSFKLVLYLYIPAQYLSLFFSAAMFCNPSTTSFEALGIVLSQGMVSTIANVASHELYHKRTFYDVLGGRLMLASFCQLYFETNHAYIHHMHVATPEDPATAKVGESIYTFIPKSIVHGIKSSWDVDVSKLTRKNQSNLHWSNPFYVYIFAPLLVLRVLTYCFGNDCIKYFFGQSLFVIVITEMLNFVEHYGMERKMIDGRYENVSTKHSWDTNAGITNYFIFKLGRHSDHHTYPTRPYQVLRYNPNNELPSGYVSMILATLIPPLFRKLMDDRVTKLNKE